MTECDHDLSDNAPGSETKTTECEHDLSDNAPRSTMLRRLQSEAALPGGGLVPWAQPAPGQPSDRAPPGSRNVWQHLNSLRVMAQYTRLLGEMCASSPFLRGAPGTCVCGLEWFAGLAGPLRPTDPEERLQLGRTLALFAATPQGSGLGALRAAFEVHRRAPCSDRGLARLLTEAHFPDAREYEVDVADHLARQLGADYAGWLGAFAKWRGRGLYHPLALAARHIPDLHHWLPEESWETPLGRSLGYCLRTLSGRATAREEEHALRDLVGAWNHDPSPAPQLLGGTLDRLAVLMGIKSNGRLGNPLDFRLAPALDAFPAAFSSGTEDMHERNYHAWRALRGSVEDTFPPSLLSAPLVRPKRPTWGHPGLTLRYEGGALAFQERSLQIVGPAGAGPNRAPIFTPAVARDCLQQQTSSRLQDILWRLGEIATDPQIALAMTCPWIAHASLRGELAGPPALQLREEVLHTLGWNTGPQQGRRVDPHYVDYTRALEAVLPPIRAVPQDPPVTALFWRLDIPPRAIVYLGGGDPGAGKVHERPKVQLNAKVHQRTIAGTVRTHPTASEADIRRALRAFAHEQLLEHPSNTVLVRRGRDPDGPTAVPLTHTTLTEALHCLALQPPLHLVSCPVGQSQPWEDTAAIDPRYAEKQLAANGFRYRDWVAMHVSRDGTQQSRLAAHAITFATLHTTKIPWLTDEGGVRWVSVAATVPPHNRTIYGATLAKAVQARYIRDSTMLPATEPGQTVTRANAELYAHGPGSVAVVYAPQPGNRLHMISFQCDE